MAKLVAFGCSLTYGHGLPDCDRPEAITGNGRRPGPHPSEFAWPRLLSDRLGMDCLNLSVPGTSNISMLMRILTHRWERGDVAAILWTFPNRDTVYQDDGTMMEVRPPLSDLEDVRKYYEVHSDRDMHMRAWLYHDHAALHLSSNGVRFAMGTLALWPRYDWRGRNHCLVDYEPLRGSNWLDLGLDGSHAGVRTHDAWANAYLKAFVEDTD